MLASDFDDVFHALYVLTGITALLGLTNSLGIGVLQACTAEAVSRFLVHVLLLVNAGFGVGRTKQELRARGFRILFGSRIAFARTDRRRLEKGNKSTTK